MKNKLILLDGAMGTMLQERGLKLGERPEIFAMEHPEVVIGVHKMYIEAGSDVIYANTFCANRHKLEGTGVSVQKAVEANIKNAQEAAQGTHVKVALSMGPIGELLEPLGTLSFEEAYDIYKEMVIAGTQAGADVIVFETFTDLLDVKAAVLAAKENSHLPVWVTMSFEENGRTFTGTTIPSMASTLEGLGVEAIGINCSLGPVEILPLAKQMREWTSLPLIIKPNAGLPDPATGKHNLDADTFAVQMKDYLDLGVFAMGGCCGSTPEFIAKIKQYKGTPFNLSDFKAKRGICSASDMCEFGGVKIIGERINPTGKKRFQQALREHDLDYILQQGIEQSDAGADILDVNVGLPGIDEVQTMKEVVKALQSVVSLPLQIDSSDPDAIEAGLRVFNGRAIINSVNGEKEKLETILPLAKKYGAAVIGLAMDENGIPETVEQRYEIAERILNAALSYGIPKEDVIIDCLTLTVSAQQSQAQMTLKAVRKVSEELGLHCTLGVSNISFGLPYREGVTENFLTQAMCCGLDFPIINPNQKRMVDAVSCFKVLSGEDKDCVNYIERFADAGKEVSQPGDSTLTIEKAIARGLKEETGKLALSMLETMSELDLINTKLIPALDVVGEDYEKGKLFLPQLINAANAACVAFDLIKKRIAQRGDGSVSKGKIIVATVQGDIHDIGKNIVKVILENYGYTVYDLGRDVPVETVVKEAIEKDVKLVGLSALMTTTVSSMEKTIIALRESGHDCKVFVGGAVLTPDYAKEIGADFYAKDAKEAVEIAKIVLG